MRSFRFSARKSKETVWPDCPFWMTLMRPWTILDLQILWGLKVRTLRVPRGDGGRMPHLHSSRGKDCWWTMLPMQSRTGLGKSMWVCLKIVYPYTHWFCWSLSLLNGYFIGNINPTFSDKPMWGRKRRSQRHNSIMKSFVQQQWRANVAASFQQERRTYGVPRDTDHTVRELVYTCICHIWIHMTIWIKI